MSAEAARPPQFKTATMSSNQISDTAAAMLAVKPPAPMTTPTNVSSGPGTAPYKIAPSDNNSTESTECSEATAEAKIMAGSFTFAPVAPPYHATPLTKDSLEQQQRKLAARSPGTLSVWVEGAAPGYARHVTLKHMGYAQPPRTDPSVASDNSYELLPSPVTQSRFESETRATGTQFDDQCIIPFLNNPELSLSVDLSAV